MSSTRRRRNASERSERRNLALGPARVCAVLMACIACGTRPVLAEPPRRVVSINLCTDQLLLALADPGQIAALGRWARNREMSFLAVEAMRHRVVRGTAEEVLRLKPDLVLAGSFSGGATRAILQARGIRVVTFTPPLTIAQARAEIVRAAAVLGHPDRGAAVLANIDSSLGGARPEPARPLTALALQRRGYVSGSDTLLSDVMAEVGFTNAAAGLGVRSIEHASLEAIAKARPDVLVVEELDRAAADQASALLGHPVLARLVPANRMVAVPVAEMTCAGPALPALIHRLSRERARASKGALP